MDIEATMQFILGSQARAETRADRAEARTNSMEKRLDKRMDAITKLLQQGMQHIVRTDKSIEALAASQRETDRELKALIKSLRNGNNGRNGR